MPITAMEYALTRIQNEIPSELITMAFKTHNLYNIHDAYSVEQLIQNKVIDNVVLNDCAMIGGRTIYIPLHEIGYSQIEAGDLYSIPLSYTNGRHIISVEGIETGHSGSENDSIPYSPVSTGTASADIVGPNMLLVKELIPHTNAHLKCRIEESRTLQDYSPRVMPLFGDMCTEAAKMVIFNILNIKLGDAATNGGSTNQYLRSALDQYSDSVSVYKELRDRWQKVSIMQDPEQVRDIIRMQF